MFIRTTKRRNRDGSTVEYYQLAHNVRDPETRRPVARILHNFGRADALDRDGLVRLARSIARVCGLELRDPALEPQPDGPDPRDLWPQELKLLGSRALGCVLVIEALWERLGIGPILRKIVAEERSEVPYERALFAMTANRLCEPQS